MKEKEMDWKEKPIVSVGNVWCACCGKKEFELTSRAKLKCTNCGTNIYFRVTWGQMETNGWNVYDRPTISSQSPYDKTPSGILWGDCFAIERFNCNNGKRLGDKKILEKMNVEIRVLERTLDKVRSEAREEERICKELASPLVEGGK